MSTIGQVHWHEGLFLQPHHLQTMQRDLAEVASRERRLNWAFPHGVVDCRVSTDALENMLVRVDRLRVVMPSGVEVDVPGNTDLPALDIKRVFEASSGNFVVSLAVPLWQSGRANTVDPSAQGGAGGGAGGAARRAVQEESRVKRLFRIAETTRPDENTGENAQPVLLRRLNARLVVEGEDTTDMEVIPLIAVAHAADEQTLPRQDPSFVPPCMVVSGSATLRNLLRDLASALEATRKEIVNQMTRAGFVPENLKGPEMLMLLRLRTLSKWSARMGTLFSGGSGGPGAVPVFEAYMELRELLADLAALSPERDPFDAPRYDHDNQGVVFMDMDRKIRGLLKGDLKGKFLSQAFVPDAGALTCPLTEEFLTQPNGYWIAIRTKMDPTVLGRLVTDGDRFKLMPKSLVKQAYVYGIPLDEDRHPPLGLPSANNLHYFRVNVGKGQTMWTRAGSEKSLAVRWPENEAFEYDEVLLYMTLP